MSIRNLTEYWGLAARMGLIGEGHYDVLIRELPWFPSVIHVEKTLLSMGWIFDLMYLHPNTYHHEFQPFLRYHFSYLWSNWMSVDSTWEPHVEIRRYGICSGNTTECVYFNKPDEEVQALRFVEAVKATMGPIMRSCGKPKVRSGTELYEDLGASRTFREGTYDADEPLSSDFNQLVLLEIEDGLNRTDWRDDDSRWRMDRVEFTVRSWKNQHRWFQDSAALLDDILAAP